MKESTFRYLTQVQNGMLTSNAAEQTGMVSATASHEEQEANQKAQHVLRQAEYEKQSTKLIGRKKKIKPRTGSKGSDKVNTDQSHRVTPAADTEGTPLPSTTRRFMEETFSADFSKVRIHSDVSSAEINDELDANAFSQGNDIYFNKGRYSPGTKQSEALLAHELTHVQQGGNTIRKSPKGSQAVAPIEMGSPNWEDAVAVMNSIGWLMTGAYPALTNGIELPRFGVTPEEYETIHPKPKDAVPDENKDLIDHWYFILHPRYTSPNGIQISIYGAMREIHLKQLIQETEPFIRELMKEGTNESVFPYLTEQYWDPLTRLKKDIAEEIVLETVAKQKSAYGEDLQGAIDTENASHAVDHALEAIHLSLKVITQFSEHGIHETIEHAEDFRKLYELDELLREAADKAGDLPHDGVINVALKAKTTLPAILVYLEGGLHGVSAILKIADPHKREEMFRTRSDLFGKLAVVTEYPKLVLQMAAAATAVAGAGTYAFAKVLGKEVPAMEALAKGIKYLEVLETAISGIMVVHGVLTLLSDDATGEEKEEAILEIGIGGATILGKLGVGVSGGPATLSVIISYFTIMPIAHAAVGMTSDLVNYSLNRCYHNLQYQASTINDLALALTMALEMESVEQDESRAGYFRMVARDYSLKLKTILNESIIRATNVDRATERDPGSHDPLLRRFKGMETMPLTTDAQLIQAAQRYVQIVAEIFTQQQEIHDEELEYVWEHYG